MWILLSDTRDSMHHEVERFLLGSGVPCTIHVCVECCVDTGMPLTDDDMKRIIGHGYEVHNFAVKREGEFYLRNHDGRCVFLGDGECDIYSFRPEGCRLYPLVYNEQCDETVIHDFCPFGDWFEISDSDVKRLRNLVDKLSERM